MVKTSPSNAGDVSSSPAGGAKILHASWSKHQHINNNRSNTVTNSIKIFKMVHVKKNFFEDFCFRVEWD